MTTAPRAIGWQLLATAPAWALSGWLSTRPWPFFSDDSFISLRYAQRLLAGEGLTWTDGERVEGYSNLLWVLSTAALGWLGLDLVVAARCLGAVATALGLWWLAGAVEPRGLRGAAIAATAPLLAAATPTVAVWTLGGLEGPLVFALLAAGFAGLLRQHVRFDGARWAFGRTLRLGLPFALACLTRPDGPLWALTAGTGVALVHAQIGVRVATQRALWFGLPSLVAVLGQLVFRLAYYGDWVPNTAHVKAEFDPASIGPGFDYVVRALAAVPGLATLAAAALLVMLATRRRVFLPTLVLPLCAWLSYLAVIGGDHFPGQRLLHGAIAPLALLVGTAAAALPMRGLVVAAVGLLGGTAVVWDAAAAVRDPGVAEASHEIWEWRARELGRALGAAFAAEQPRIAVDAAGALPYYSGLPALDMLGLCDRTIATTPFAAWLDTVVPGTPKPPGHLRGNGSYVMAAAPDLVLFNNAPGLPLPVFVSACEFEADPRFLDGYRGVLLDLGEREIQPGRREPLVAPLWVRTEGRAGVRRDGDTIVIPAWLFDSLRYPGVVQGCYQPPAPDPAVRAARAANLGAVVQWFTERRTTAAPDETGGWTLNTAPNQPLVFPWTPPAGLWVAELDPPAGTGAVRLRFSTDAASQDALAEVGFRSDGRSAAEFELTVVDGAPRVRMIRLRRAAD